MKLKLFISMPMRNKELDEIRAKRDALAHATEEYVHQELDVIDSIYPGNTDDKKSTNPLYWLGKALQDMNDANIVVFAKGWQKAKGCVIEHAAAEAYGKIIYQETDMKKQD